MDAYERTQLISKLDFVEENTTNDDIRRLAETLKTCLESEDFEIVETPMTFSKCRKQRREMFMDRWLPRNIHKALLCLGLIALGTLAARNLDRLLFSTRDVQKMIHIIAGILDKSVIQVTSTANLFSLWISLEAVMGIVFMVAAILFLVSNEDRGFNFCHKTLVLSISLANIFVIYFNQFTILPFVLFQFFILWVLKHYREREFIQDGIMSS